MLRNVTLKNYVPYLLVFTQKFLRYFVLSIFKISFVLQNIRFGYYNSQVQLNYPIFRFRESYVLRMYDTQGQNTWFDL